MLGLDPAKSKFHSSKKEETFCAFAFASNEQDIKRGGVQGLFMYYIAGGTLR